MMKQDPKIPGLCLLLCVFLLTACVKRAAEETLPTDMTTQPAAQTDEGLDEGELPQVTLPQQTEPSTQPSEDNAPSGGNTADTTSTETTKPDEETESPPATEPTEVTTPSEATEPPEGTQSPESTEPTQATQPTESTEAEPTEQPRFDEDELPPIPVG